MSATKLPDAALLGAVADLLAETHKANHASVRDLVAELARGRERIDEYGNVIETKFQALEIRTREFVASFVTSLNLRNGEPGEPGPAGLQGERGLPGEAGLPGFPGERGLPGEIGPIGERGLPGELGPIGPVGPPGERGERGEAGPQGIAGERGEQGVTGVTGAAGAAGAQGAPGPLGPPGERGEQGPLGLQGEKGLQGEAGPIGPAAPPWRHRRAYDATVKDYRAGDVVAHEGGSLVALVDNPGACPGEDWASLTQRGKPGRPGEKGEKGDKGVQGRDGTGIDDLFIERGMLVVLLTDGRHKELSLQDLVTA